MSVKRFPNRLAVRIAAPIVISWLFAGALLYSFVLSSTSDFFEAYAGENMEWISSVAFNAMNRRHEDLIRDGMYGSPGYLQVAKVRALAEIEDFLRRYRVWGLIYESSPEGPKNILSTSMSVDAWAPVAEKMAQNSVVAVVVDGEKYYAYQFEFQPWKWRVLLVKQPQVYAALEKKVITAYVATGLILLLAACFVLYSQYVSVNVPIRRIIGSLKKGEAPSYKGVYEFAFLSDAIYDMMRSLEALNKNLEGLVHDRTKTLEEKAAELAEANRKLLELDDLKSAFISSVSHELRTPLTSIRGFAKLTRKDFAKSCLDVSDENAEMVRVKTRMRKNLEIIEREGERLTMLINDVLDVNEIESGRAVWHDREVDAAAILDAAAKDAGEALLEKPGLTYVAVVPETLPPLFVDPERLRQALYNVLDNAAKFTDQGEVRATIEIPAPGRMRFTVEDAGRGMEQAELEHVFDRFHQVGHARTLRDKPKGTGLGLAVCRLIVARYGGTIGARSTPGKGSVFTIELPLRFETESTQGDGE